MNEIILFYSYGGNTEKIAKQRAAETGAELFEVSDARHVSTLAAYVKGSFRAMKRRTADATPVTAELAGRKITLMAPVWAGHPAPAMNNMIAALPKGCEVSLVLVSGSGRSAGSAAGTKALVEARGCTVVGYEDIKAGN